MAIPIDIDKIVLRNFMSYGNYDTEVEIGKLGQCLITGEVVETAPAASLWAAGDDETPVSSNADDRSNGAGKCLAADSLIVCRDGSRRRIADIAVGTEVCSIDSHLRACYGTVVGHAHTGRKRCWCLTTRSGRELLCSLDHRFLTIDGWAALRTIAVGQPIAVSRNLAVEPVADGISTAEAELIGLMLGDGTFRKYTPTICISDDEPEVKSRVETLIATIDPTSRLTMTKTTKKGKSYRVVRNESRAVSDVSYVLNPVTAPMRKRGLIGKTKEHKFIPDVVFTSKRAIWVALLTGFWQADGWLSVGASINGRLPRIEVGCCNRSETIIRQIQHLLLRLDIRSRIRRRMALCSTNGWVLHIQTDCILPFLDIFGVALANVGCAVRTAQLVRSKAIASKFASNNVDLVPGAIWPYVIARLASINKTWRDVVPRTLRLSRSLCAAGRRASSRAAIRHVGERLADQRLIDLGSSAVVWDEVASIVDAGIQDTYDIEVKCDGEGNFSANDIITHNSALLNAILWGFFGRTMHAAQPGDRVVNWYSGAGCLVSIHLANGDVITRTRKTDGHNELIVQRGGEAVLSTRSTTSNQQAELARLYGLDWSIFTGSSFFTQYGRPWLEMTEPQRKEALERVLRLDRLTLYADVAKQKVVKMQARQEALAERVASQEQMLTSLRTELQFTEEAKQSFEAERADRRRRALGQARDYKQSADLIKVPNLDDLKRLWQKVEQVRRHIRDLQDQQRQWQVEAADKARQAAAVQERIGEWESKAGKICLECEQEVAHEHVGTKVEPLQRQLAALTAAAAEAERQLALVQRRLTAVERKLAEVMPEQTVREAEALRGQRNSLLVAAKRALEQADHIKTEQNPHEAAIARLTAKIAELEADLESAQQDRQRLDVLVRHGQYIHKSYSDRRKIKQFRIARYLPLFNRRLRHYLDAFELGVKIELTESLGVATDCWGYDFLSGGERKRADLSFMFAVFDLHEELYGRQCNLIVLDEVDGRLDGRGIACLVNVIKSDLASRVKTVLVISHRDQMLDTFPHQIVVQRRGHFSLISEIR